jgi:hypothetical protein
MMRKRQIADKNIEGFEYKMSYQQALEAAGARVIAFEHFGDWQGSWVALVEYQGQRGWVQGAFGSCDYCDAFKSQFSWDSDFTCQDVQEQLAQFGRTYLDDLQTTEQILRQYDADAHWDDESEAAAFWVRETEKTYGAVHNQ